MGQGQALIFLTDKHSIAEGIKSIILLFGDFISGQQTFTADESRQHHQQSRLGQMKIGEHGIHSPPSVAWIDKQAGIALKGGHGLRRLTKTGGGFKGAGRGRADGDDAAAGPFGSVDDVSIAAVETGEFAVDPVFGNAPRSERLKGVQPNMQSAVSQFDAFALQTRQQLGRKMQAGRRRRGRAFNLAIDRLIAFIIIQIGPNIRRQRNLAQLGQQRLQRLIEFKNPFGFFQYFDNAAGQITAAKP